MLLIKLYRQVIPVYFLFCLHRAASADNRPQNLIYQAKCAYALNRFTCALFFQHIRRCICPFEKGIPDNYLHRDQRNL